ncbi:MAG: heavy metal-binding domain-containing protein [Myxococcales bacterium]|nr:hypothetical protein [Myxococcales bacterium]
MNNWMLALVSSALIAGPGVVYAQEHEEHKQVYTCPMHPETRSEKPGKCPICGMTLVPVQAREHGADEHESMPGMEHGAPAVPGPQPLSFTHSREGSGTSWMPDSSPVFAHHFMAGEWMLMLHYAVAIGYDDQWSDRGSRRITSTNWIMGMASHPLLGGQITLRTMLSAEPATAAGELQLPLLLQSGETYAGQPLHDRQHPHDLFMEVAAIYRRPIGDAFGFELYAAPSGEPALGPTAFMHRPSAMNNPFPPIGHHWQDSTHISFGVLTAGVYNRSVKLEGSIFHGREPDENRWDFDLGALDSWSGRVSVNPTQQTSFQVSYGYVNSPEAARPEESLHRVTASGSYGVPVLSDGNVALTALWGRNVESGHSSDSALVEANLDLDGKNVPFLRVEYVQKLGHDLVLAGEPDAKYDIFQGSFGYVHRFTGLPVVPVIGASVDIGLVPGSIEAEYGTRAPVGAFVFIGLQPPRMSMGHEHHMSGM